MNLFSLQFSRETEERDTFDKTEAECSDGCQQEAENIQKEVLVPGQLVNRTPHVLIVGMSQYNVKCII